MTTTKLPKRIALITSCSSTRVIPPLVRVEDLPIGLTMKQALDIWCEELEKFKEDSLSPRELYRGMGFITLAKIDQLYDISAVKIITGGQGFIDIDVPIVPYDFTASPKETHNIHQKVTAEPFLQTAWWRMINQKRFDNPSPVASFIRDFDGLVIISCSKIFLRYISDDLISGIDVWDKVRVLLSASSVGSVPIQLRPIIVPFDRTAVGHLPGNRNDNNHRAALQFLNLCQKNSEWIDLSPYEQAMSMNTIESPKTVTANLEEIFNSSPALLEMTADEAYKVVKRFHGTVGGKMAFRAFHRQKTGNVSLPDATEIETAKSILEGMNFATANVQDSDEEVAVAALNTFVQALKTLNASANFNTSDVCSWAEKYFTKIDKPIPTILTSPNKTSYLLKSNASLLGIREADGEGMKGFNLDT